MRPRFFVHRLLDERNLTVKNGWEGQLLGTLLVWVSLFHVKVLRYRTIKPAPQTSPPQYEDPIGLVRSAPGDDNHNVDGTYDFFGLSFRIRQTIVGISIDRMAVLVVPVVLRKANRRDILVSH